MRNRLYRSIAASIAFWSRGAEAQPGFSICGNDGRTCSRRSLTVLPMLPYDVASTHIEGEGEQIL
jgi:hypothetical protein